MTTQQYLKAKYGQPDKPLNLGGFEIPCYVLEDGTRVLVGRNLSYALSGRQTESAKMSGQRFSRMITHKDFLPYIDNELRSKLDNPIKFSIQGKKAFGFEATCLPRLCNAFLKARDSKIIPENHTYYDALVASDIIVRSLAEVGIAALIDEVTGYQEVRGKNALQKILEAYIAKELLPWAKRFPDEFYKEMFRLRGWKYPTVGSARPSVVGKWTNDIVYERMPEGVLEELRTQNPRDDKGRLKKKHHQYLTQDIGNVHLERHLTGVIALMRASSNWDNFQRNLVRAYPKSGDQMPLSI